jgi:hypothetical protein
MYIPLPPECSLNFASSFSNKAERVYFVKIKKPLGMKIITKTIMPPRMVRWKTRNLLHTISEIIQ